MPEWKPDFGPGQRSTPSTALRRSAPAISSSRTTSTSTRPRPAGRTRSPSTCAKKVASKPSTASPRGKAVLDEKGEQGLAAGNAQMRQGHRLVHRGVRRRPDFDEPDQYLRHARARGFFDAVCERSQARGIRVTGSELVGLIPLQAVLDAGRYFLRKQQRSVGVCDAELIKDRGQVAPEWMSCTPSSRREDHRIRPRRGQEGEEAR